MEKKEIDYTELLKYPVITLCIVVGLYFLHLFVGLDFGQVSRISAEGIEFREKQAASNALAVLSLSQRVSNVERTFNATNVTDRAATEIVDDAIGRLSYIDAAGGTCLKNKEGYIWLGRYDEAGKVWLGMTLRSTVGKEVIGEQPDKVVSRQYATAHSLVLRSELPTGNEASLPHPAGVIPGGAVVLLYGVQAVDGNWWARIKVEQ